MRMLAEWLALVPCPVLDLEGLADPADRIRANAMTKLTGLGWIDLQSSEKMVREC
jgi:hypothetical protein